MQRAVSLRLDPRDGSKELKVPLLNAGLTVEVGTLPAGDVEITGRGPGGRPLLVGVEYKQVRDMLTCVRDGRFAEQLRKMKARHEVRWLLVEGEWRETEAGLLEVRERKGFKERGRFTAQEVVAWLLTMTQCGGVLPWFTHDQDESVAWLRALYWWWTSKDYEKHRAHLDWYTPPYAPPNPFEDEPGVVQKVAAALLAQGVTVDVNSERARAAGKHFATVRAMVDADESVWRGVEGIGPKTAKRVVGVLR